MRDTFKLTIWLKAKDGEPQEYIEADVSDRELLNFRTERSGHSRFGGEFNGMDSVIETVSGDVIGVGGYTIDYWEATKNTNEAG